MKQLCSCKNQRNCWTKEFQMLLILQRHGKRLVRKTLIYILWNKAHKHLCT